MRKYKSEFERRLRRLHNTIYKILVLGQDPHTIYPYLFSVLAYLWGKNYNDITKEK